MLVSIFQIKNLKFVRKLYLISTRKYQFKDQTSILSRSKDTWNPISINPHRGRREVSERQQRIIRRFDG